MQTSFCHLRAAPTPPHSGLLVWRLALLSTVGFGAGSTLRPVAPLNGWARDDKYPRTVNPSRGNLRKPRYSGHVLAGP